MKPKFAWAVVDEDGDVIDIYIRNKEAMHKKTFLGDTAHWKLKVVKVKISEVK